MNDQISERLKRYGIWTVLVVVGWLLFANLGQSGMFTLVLISTLVGGIVLTFLKFGPPTSETVRIKNASPEFALQTAVNVVRMLDDDLVGFPSGTFVAHHDGATFEAHEYQPKSVAFDTFKRVALWPWRATGFVAEFFDEAAVGVVLAVQGFRAFLTASMAYVLLVPLGFALITEFLVKPLAASRIVGVATADGSDALLELSFHGASARLVKSRFVSAFAAAKLPERYLKPAV